MSVKAVAFTYVMCSDFQGMVVLYLMTYYMGTGIWKFYVPGLTNVVSGIVIEISLYREYMFMFPSAFTSIHLKCLEQDYHICNLVECNCHCCFVD